MWDHFLAHHYGLIFIVVVGAIVGRIHRLNGYFAKASRRERWAYTLCGCMAMLFYVVDFSTRLNQPGSTWKSVLFDTFNILELVDRTWISCWVVHEKQEDVTWYSVLNWMWTADIIEKADRV